MKVDTTGIPRGALLAALFNQSRPLGMGILQAGRGPSVMTDKQGAEYVAAALDGNFGHDTAMAFGMVKPGLYFDYLFGRPLKVDITSDEVEASNYDRDNGGEGTLAAIVTRLREKSC